jgi:hypothetical protein
MTSYKFIITALLISWSVISFAQTKNPVQTHITFGKGIACEASSDICNLTTMDKAAGNVQMWYDTKTQELVFSFEQVKQESANLQKLLAKPVKGTNKRYLYTFTSDYILPPDILAYLNLKEKYAIPKGNYFVTLNKNRYILRTKLIKVK